MSNKEVLAEHNERLSAIKAVIPSGTLNITENGTYNVKQYASTEVDVPVPDGYVYPTGTHTITENGTHDVKNYAWVEVSVGTEVLPAPLTVNFAQLQDNYNEETDESWSSFPSAPATGSYTIDDGGAVYFENAASLSIEASVGSVIKINLSSIDGGWSSEYATRDAVGCEGDYLCVAEGHEPWEEGASKCGEYGCLEGVLITITEETASVTVYEVNY